MGIGTLGVIAWGEHTGDATLAHTMGFVTFSLFNLFFSIATKDDRKSMFTLDTVADRTLMLASGISLGTIILATVFGPFQALLSITRLDLAQWLLCAGVALSVIVVSEVRKAVLRRVP
jgi:Ca2+-transporting ATPase